jgi:uncharacterized protein YukJ
MAGDSEAPRHLRGGVQLGKEVGRMPIGNYGVLVGSVAERRREPEQDTPHYQIRVRSGQDDHRIAVNVQSAVAPSQLLYLVCEDFTHPVLDGLTALSDGWTMIPSQPSGIALDFVRGNLLDPAAMRLLPAEQPGADNDLADLLDAHVLRAAADPHARVYAFGEPWGPQPDAADPVFGFVPGRGVHNIHMNQGNVEQFARDDGVWQDGALLLHFPAAGRWVSIFLAFQSQAWHTDDLSGHPLDAAVESSIRIVAALVNPLGPSPEMETVTVLNASPQEVDLSGWSLADRDKRRHPIPPVMLAAGESLRVQVAAPFTLGNSGGAITVLDPAGLKVDGISYTAEQAAREGWTVIP